MDDRRHAGSDRAFERRRELGRRFDRLAVAAEGARVGREIGVVQRPSPMTRPGYSRSWCMRIVPYMPLSITMTTIGRPY